MSDDSSNVINLVNQLVDDLYAFRDNYVINSGIENASKKDADVRIEMNSVVDKLKTLESSCHTTTYMLQLGRAYNVMTEYDERCEEYLSKVVKRDPTLVDAWNNLGETFWKKRDFLAAKDCFMGSLKQKRNKVALRSLSIVMRQVAATNENVNKNIVSCVTHAKEAVEMDINDGTSWYILGNSYLYLFFKTEQSPKILQLCLNAYTQAEKVDPNASNNPDLQYNRAQAFRYEESFELALTGWRKALRLDPSLVDSASQIKLLTSYLDKLCCLLTKKGKLKNKRLQNMLKSINKEKDLGPYLGGTYSNKDSSVSVTPSTLAALEEGQNHGKVIVGKVIFNMADLTLVPFTFGIMDTDGNCAGISVYNLVQSRGVIIGDSVAIPDPYLTRYDFEWESNKWKFPCVRVSNPVVLVVNGKKLTKEHCSYTQATMMTNDATLS